MKKREREKLEGEREGSVLLFKHNWKKNCSSAYFAKCVKSKHL
jgi:hypothetical protein